MVYKRCLKCNRLFNSSIFDKTIYQQYCKICGFQIYESNRADILKETVEELSESLRTTPVIEITETETDTSVETTDTEFKEEIRKIRMDKKRLHRTDGEEDYLDSTRCKFSRLEVSRMKEELKNLETRIQSCRVSIRQLYSEINLHQEKIQRIKCDLAVANEEQKLRKRLRRETRDFLPSLKKVNDNANNVYKNIHELVGSDDDECIIISPYFNNKN